MAEVEGVADSKYAHLYACLHLASVADLALEAGSVSGAVTVWVDVSLPLVSPMFAYTKYDIEIKPATRSTAANLCKNLVTDDCHPPVSCW